MQLTEEQIRRIARQQGSKSASAAISNIMAGNQSVANARHANEADHATNADNATEAAHAASAAALDDDSAVWDKLKQLFLSKTDDDTAAGLIIFLKGIVTEAIAQLKKGATFGEFISGLYTGKGGQVDSLGNAELESLKIRTSLQVVELIVNRLRAMDADILLTEGDTIESVTKDSDGTYTLKLREKWDGYFTAQAENNVIKGIYNTLAKGSGDYYTSWMRVNSVNTANNTINVTLYPDDETPAGQNFEPQPMMNIARWGNQTDKSRQSCFYFSSTEGRIVKLINVTKPILDDANYGATFGSLPEFVPNIKDSDGNLLPIKEGLDYVYTPGIVYMDAIKLNKWTLEREPEYVDRGGYDKSQKYYCRAENPDTGVFETSDVWYFGCKFRCQKNLTANPPAWNSTDWAMIEGNPDFTVDFAEPEQLVDADNINIPLTIIAKLYNQDVTDDILTSDIAWTRYSEDADGVERVNDDNAWAAKRAGAGKQIILTADDMGFNGYMPKKIQFKATVTLRDGETEKTAEVIKDVL